MQLSSSPTRSERFTLVSASITTAATTEEAPRGASPLHAARHLIEPDPNSFTSDYSELGEPIHEHLAGVQIIGRDDLDLGNTVSSSGDVEDRREGPARPGKHQLSRQDNETEEQFARRVRKTNYLSLAQEFAELKRLNADALPFDLHRDAFQSSTTSPGLSTDDDDDDDDLDDDEEDHVPPCAETSPTHPDAIPDLIPNQRTTADDVPGRDGCDGLENLPPSLHNGHSDDPGRSSPLDLQRNLQKCSGDEFSGRRPTANVDQPSTTKITQESQARRTVADDTAACGTDEFDVYTIETALPHVEWERIEESLRMSAGEQKKRWSRCSDRDEIRRRLAMSADDDFYCGAGGEFDFSVPRRGPSSSFHAGGRSMHGSASLQVCFVNDVAADLDRDPSTAVHPAAASSSTAAAAAAAAAHRYHPKPDVIPKSISEASTLSSVHCKIASESAHEDFFTKQARLQAEAKLALAQVRPMAHMQLQIEKEMRKKTSPLSETVVGISGFVDGKMRQLSRQLLQRMNIAQLQVVVNDLHTQIEALNSELMQQLVDRDDLHMAQDSMLVDIDDLTRRAQEFAAKVNKRNSTAADAGCK